MKKKSDFYTDEPIEFGEEVPNLLPKPEDLVRKTDSIKVTLALSIETVVFFKQTAQELGTQYQTMIRNLLDYYVEEIEGMRDTDRNKFLRKHRKQYTRKPLDTTRTKAKTKREE